MRWSIIGLIWWRELRDLARDRRTLVLIFIVPLLLYPGMGAVGLVLSLSMADQTSVIGIEGNRAVFPPRSPFDASLSPLPGLAWLALTPESGSGGVAGGVAFARASQRSWDFPPLIQDSHFNPDLVQNSFEQRQFRIVPIAGDPQTALDERHVDVVVQAVPDFWEQLAAGGQPSVRILARDGDDRSKQAKQRLTQVLNNWTSQVMEVRLRRQGLPSRFIHPIAILDADKDKPPLERITDELFEMLVKVFPFLVVMWSLAGALYPAVDLAAGEKERGTLETLLVSPATRTEIVWGKFLAIWVFSTATTEWNLLGLIGSFLLVGMVLPISFLRPAGLIVGAIMVLPLSALFSAICLAVGAYARSTKEGQYYLMPLLLVTVLLLFIALAPGAELTPLYSIIPVTNAALLQQRLMTATAANQVPWLYIVPVFGSLGVALWLSLRWAVSRFQKEEVLFRSAEAGRTGLRWWRK